MKDAESEDTRNMNSPEKFVSTAEVAEYLNKPTSWVHDNAGRMRIPRYKLGNQYRYLLSEVAEWVSARAR